LITHDKYLAEIDALIKTGEALTRKAQSSGSYLGDSDIIEASSWVTRTGEMIQRIYPANSQHRESYKSCIKTSDFGNMHSHNYSHLAIITGLLRSMRHEISNGLITDINQLLRADIFADFLEMAEHLLDEKYKDASAVIIGSVLEDTLRKLAAANNIPILKDGKHLTIEPLNTALAAAGIYNKLFQKQITSWADLRNKAAHGQYDQYDYNQVRMMLLFTQDFASNYLR